MDQTKITKLLRLMKLLTGNVYAMGKVARTDGHCPFVSGLNRGGCLQIRRYNRYDN